MPASKKSSPAELTFDPKQTKNLRIGITVAEWNKSVTEILLKSCAEELQKFGVKDKNIFVQWVPGSFELPAMAKWMIAAKEPDAVICLGCIIKGETEHDMVIAHAISQGIMDLNIRGKCPVVMGVLTTTNIKQALARSEGPTGFKGKESAQTALKMIIGKKLLNQPTKGKIGF